MFKKIAAAAALVAASSCAFAAEPASFYAGVDASSTKIEGLDREGGYGAFIGYNFNPGFAVEAGYHRLADTDYSVGATSAKVTLDQIDVSVIGTVPLSNGFSVFGRLGYNRLEADASVAGFDASEHDSGAVVGLGLGYSFSREIGARLEVQRPGNDTTKIAAGISFNF